MTRVRELLTSTQVAAALGKSRHWFYRHRKDLQEKGGFPLPVLPGRWDPAAINDWLDAKRAGVPLTPAAGAVLAEEDDELPDNVVDVRTQLKLRARHLANSERHT